MLLSNNYFILTAFSDIIDLISSEIILFDSNIVVVMKKTISFSTFFSEAGQIVSYPFLRPFSWKSTRAKNYILVTFMDFERVGE